MFVYEYTLKLKCLKDIEFSEASEAVGGFIDYAFSRVPEMLEFHNKRQYKLYTYDLPYPFEADKVYFAGKIYTVHIRTVSQELAEFFMEKTNSVKNRSFLAMGGSMKILPKSVIDKVYSLTPVVIKNDFGYWKTHLSRAEFEKRITDNLIKKYNYITKNKLNEDFEICSSIEFINHKPIKIAYKGINLLGDKLEIVPASNELAQEIFYMALGTGLGENNSRGLGYLGYKYCR